MNVAPERNARVSCKIHSCSCKEEGEEEEEERRPLQVKKLQFSPYSNGVDFRLTCRTCERRFRLRKTQIKISFCTCLQIRLLPFLASAFLLVSLLFI